MFEKQFMYMETCNLDYYSFLISSFGMIHLDVGTSRDCLGDNFNQIRTGDRPMACRWPFLTETRQFRSSSTWTHGETRLLRWHQSRRTRTAF